MKKKIVVYYTAMFRSTIEVEENATQEEISDAMTDINIPENDGSEYIMDTFEPETNDEGMIIQRDFNYC